MPTNQNLKVKDLKEEKKNLYKVEIAEQAYLFVTDTVLKYRLVKGKEVTNIDEIINFNNKILYLNKIRNYALKYPKSIYNLKLYLKEKYEDIDSEYIINILINEGIIDDKRYALNKYYALKSKNYGQAYIINYLLYKEHIDKEIINNIIENDKAEIDLKPLIAKLLIKYKGDKAKVINYLLRKGHKYNDIKSALEV